MITNKYQAIKLLKELTDTYPIYLKVGNKYDNLYSSDIEMDEDDIVIRNVKRIKDINDDQKLEFANELLNLLSDSIDDRHVDLESLEDTCMSGIWICNALKKSKIIDSYD